MMRECGREIPEPVSVMTFRMYPGQQFYHGSQLHPLVTGPPQPAGAGSQELLILSL